jgi:hypothetical protein
MNKERIKPFGDVQPEWADRRHNIMLSDAGMAYRADNDKFKFPHIAFRVDKLLKEETAKKQCDFLLLRIKGQQHEGAAFFVECKDSRQENEIKDSVKQLEHTYERLKLVYSEWHKGYDRIGFRIVSSISKSKLTDKYFINIKKIAKRHGGSFDIRRFGTEKEIDIFDGEIEFKQRQ